jgi:hypothetical protein
MARPLDRSGNLPKRSKWRNRPVLAGAVVFLLVVAIWRRNAPRVEESAKPALSQAALPSVVRRALMSRPWEAETVRRLCWSQKPLLHFEAF